LFIGVRNKYCSIFQKTCANNKDPPVHFCYKNWNGTSTAMEADIIVEGFCQMNTWNTNVQYNLPQTYWGWRF